MIGSTKINLVKGTANLSFEDPATIIRLSFGTTNDQSLVGVHTLKIEASLANFPEMDTIMKVSGTFSVEVVSDTNCA